MDYYKMLEDDNKKFQIALQYATSEFVSSSLNYTNNTYNFDNFIKYFAIAMYDMEFCTDTVTKTIENELLRLGSRVPLTEAEVQRRILEIKLEAERRYQEKKEQKAEANKIEY